MGEMNTKRVGRKDVLLLEYEYKDKLENYVDKCRNNTPISY